MVDMAGIFTGGDKVFAKIRGHPAWPARVESIADSSPNTKYHVLFYGTFQRGICRSNEIVSFAENKEKYGNIKRKGFKEALDQIEGVSPVPELVPTIVDEKYINGFSNVNNNIDRHINMKRREVKKKEATFIQEVDSLKNFCQTSDGEDTAMQKQQKILTDDSRNQNSLEVDIVPLISDSDPHAVCTPCVTKKEKIPLLKTTPKTRKKNVRAKQATLNSSSHFNHDLKECQIQSDTFCDKSIPSHSSNSDESLEKQSSVSGSETISRSGRVIKRKSFHDESEISRPKQKRIIQRIEKDNAQSSTKLNLPRRQKLTKEVATSKKKQKPRKEVATSKKKQKPRKEVATSQKDAAVKKQTVRKWLATENNLTKLDTLVRSQLSISKANPEQCIRYLDDLKKLRLKPLMLKKHPEVVETIKRLRKYVGNTSAWNFSEDQKKEFYGKASRIRDKAEAIFEKFKSMFCTRDSITFLKMFADSVIAFQAKTQNWPLEEVYALTSEPEIKEKPLKPQKTTNKRK